MTLTAELTAQVRALAARAAEADGVEPLNEEAHFALRDGTGEHHLATEDGAVVGYLHWQPAYRTAQLVVDPAHRRRGHGRTLLGSLPNARFGGGPAGGEGEAEERPDWGVWAFGDLPPARGFAAALGLAATRGLLVMERGLDGVAAPDPDGLTLRGFTDGDAGAFLAVNAAAFAHHPEQGALDLRGFQERTGEPWFDPAGLILGFDEDGLAGFHWTKLVDGVGEVYVIGVAPRAQGRGYGRVLLQSGLHHLARAGAAHVLLYVDMAEPVAVRMYESAGFRVATRDVLYAPEHGSVQKRERS